MKNFLAVILLTLVGTFLTTNAYAAIKCGDFLLRSKPDGWMYINDVKPDSQKITFLERQDDYNNIEVQWLVADHRKAQLYAMAFIKRSGKSHLNVQILRNGPNDRPHIRSYDCVNVK